jgi:ring-1,2-phenylacetyl-CoA epoxidase subunit PaaE
MPGTTILRVVDIKQETADTISIHFPQPKVHKLWYFAGQFITLIVEIEGKKHLRSYSICTERRLDDTVAVAVKRQPGGLVSNYLHDNLNVGDSLELIKPSGKFYVETSVKNQRHIYLIGGGSGITPLMSILRAILFNETKSKVSLLYANRSEKDIIFRDWLERLKEKFPDRFNLVHVLSNSTSDQDDSILHGRIDTHIVERLIRQFRQPGFPEKFFLCGPMGLMETAKGTLLGMGVEDSAILEEHFAGGAPPLPDNVDPTAPSREVSLQLWGETHKVIVSPGNSILDAALMQELWLPHSCRRGHCSTCIGKIESGKVKLRSNESLTPEDIANGYTLTCQAMPLDDEVEIKIGL